MDDKRQILALLKREFMLWDELLARVSEGQATAPQVPSNLSLKDVIVRLSAWQQYYSARMEAALHNRQPVFPGWPPGLDPESERDRDSINAWIDESCCGQPWPGVYRDWRGGFLRFLKLGQAIPERDLLDARRYPWMEGRPLLLVLLASYECHHEAHGEAFQAWFGQDRDWKTAP
jgi:hypothetical protein